MCYSIAMLNKDIFFISKNIHDLSLYIESTK